jgi:pyroglutamyl-peptidase
VSAPLVLVTGFGSFEEVEDNPSAAVARELGASPPAGIEVRSAVLPVSFARAPEAVDAFLGELAPRIPSLLLGLGVDTHGSGYRLELCARGQLEGAERVDVDGVSAAAATRSGAVFQRTGLDLAGLPGELHLQGHTGVRLSEDAGGYVCEHIYHHLLFRGHELGCPSLFVHVPPVQEQSISQQTRLVSAVIRRILARPGPSSAR